MTRRAFWGLDDSIGYLARIVFRRFTRAFETRTSPDRISTGQYALLRSLWETDGIAQHDIAHQLGLCEPTVAVTARRLERSGLLRRVVNASNRRETLVYVTRKGRDLKASLAGASHAAHAAAMKNLSVDEIVTLHALLCRVERNLAAFEAALSDPEPPLGVPSDRRFAARAATPGIAASPGRLTGSDGMDPAADRDRAARAG